MILEKKRFKNISSEFLLFRNYLPLKKGMAIPENKLKTQPFKDVVFQVCLKLTHLFWNRRFLDFDHVLCYVVITSPFKISLALHVNKLEFQSPKDYLYQVWKI